MDNVGKALVMAGGVLMFVISISVAVYLYSSLMNYIDDISYVADINNRVEQAIPSDDDNVEQTVGRAEIIMSLININDFGIDKIVIEKISEKDNNKIRTTYTKTSENTFRRGNSIKDNEVLKYDYAGDSAIADEKYTVLISTDKDKKNVITYTYKV